MWRLKRGKRPELLKRGFEINLWNEYEKIVGNKKLTIRKRNIRVCSFYEDDFWGKRFSDCELLKEDLIDFQIIDLVEELLKGE